MSTPEPTPATGAAVDPQLPAATREAMEAAAARHDANGNRVAAAHIRRAAQSLGLPTETPPTDPAALAAWHDARGAHSIGAAVRKAAAGLAQRHQEQPPADLDGRVRFFEARGAATVASALRRLLRTQRGEK